MDTEGANKIWYEANCHCRQIRLRLRITPLYASEADTSTKPLSVINCNCSICTKNGYLNVMLHDPVHDIEWLSGKDSLKKYSFASGNAEHMFCPTCGSSIVLYVDTAAWEKEGKKKISVNVRMIKGIEIEKLALWKVNGATDFGEPYDP